MEAQKFLKRYEQDQCEYCHLNSDGYIKALFLERNDYDDEDFLRIESCIVSGNKLFIECDGLFGNQDPCISKLIRIKYCPMCGRELTKEV